jgi:hypothetical protein
VSFPLQQILEQQSLLLGTGNGTHYVILYEKGAGCPIGTADDIGNITNKSDFTVTGISNDSNDTKSQLRISGRYCKIQ